ncbi:hypothetical protein ACN28E_00455 [Archangium lansingense]|uniref:hypothetical protein n=1 Tax=Archangium lansingense TaxID=2995310 RepID=UPI003B820EA9
MALRPLAPVPPREPHRPARRASTTSLNDEPPMKDPPRLLGSLFLAWAVAQVIVLGVALTVAPYQGAVPPFFWVPLLLSALAYGGVGYLLRRHAPQARVPAIVLSALALLSFPVGTALGIYGLWTLLGRREARTGA